MNIFFALEQLLLRPKLVKAFRRRSCAINLVLQHVIYPEESNQGSNL